MKKTVKRILISISAVFVLIIAVVFSGCGTAYKDPWEYKKEENGFSYILIGVKGGYAGFGNKAEHATILKYNTTDEIIDELVIPEKLGGYPVKYIGYSWETYYCGPYDDYGINCENVKKVIINSEIYIQSYGLKKFNGTMTVNAKATIHANYFNSCYMEINVQTSEIQISRREYAEYTSTNNIKAVNFDAIGGIQKTYAVIAKNGIVQEPEAPTKEGYTFDGWWYTVEDQWNAENNYEVKWNFEEDKVTQNMTLYAKWI